MPQKLVERKDGSKTMVVADTDKDLNDAVKSVSQESSTSTIDINRPVEEGHDLVVVNADGTQELSDQVPEDALNFNPDVNQKFNQGGTGAAKTASNSPAAKEAAEAAADVQEAPAKDRLSATELRKDADTNNSK